MGACVFFKESFVWIYAQEWDCWVIYIWNIIYGKKEPFHRKENHGMENRFVVAEREGGKLGWIGNLGLIDANYCLWNG